MRKQITIDAANCRSLAVNQAKVGADELTLLIPEVDELTDEFAVPGNNITYILAGGDNIHIIVGGSNGQFTSWYLGKNNN